MMSFDDVIVRVFCCFIMMYVFFCYVNWLIKLVCVCVCVWECNEFIIFIIE